MELKSCFASLVLLFLLVTPCIARGVRKVESEEIYVIDYRGPETHSYIPPPSRSGNNMHIHHKKVALHRKSKHFRTVKGGGKGKKIHG